MGTIQQLFSDPVVVVDHLAGLTDGSFISSDVIDNTGDRYITADIQITVVPDGGPSSTGYIKVYLMRSLDNMTWDAESEDCTLLAVWTINQAQPYTYSIDTDVVGNLSPYWRVLFENRTGVILASDGNAVNFVGKKFETV